MERFLLGLLVGAVLGGGLVVLLRSDRETPFETSTVREGAKDAPVGARRESGTVPLGLADRSPSDPTAEFESSLPRLIANLPELELPAGDGVIDGRVTDPEGRPVAGVPVTFYVWSVEGGRPFADPSSSFSDWALAAIRKEQERRRWIFETRTDSEGTFRLEGLPRGLKYSVFERLEDWNFRRGDLSQAYYLPDATVSLVAEPVAWVTVDIREASGRAADKAQVMIAEGNVVRSHGWDATHRRIRASAGSVSILAEIAGQKSEPLAVKLEPGENHVSLEFEVGASGAVALRGEIRFDGPAPGRLVVRCARIESPAEAIEETLRSRGREQSSYGRPTYAFQCGLVTPGLYAIAAFDESGKLCSEISTVTVSSEAVNVVVPGLRCDPREWLVVRARDPEGHPVRLSNGEATIVDENGRIDWVRGVRFAPDALWVRFPDSSPAGSKSRYCVDVDAGEFGRAHVERDTPTGEVTLELQTPVDLEVILPEDRAKLTDLVDVEVRRAGTGFRRAITLEPTPSGRRVARRLQPGELEILVRLPDQEQVLSRRTFILGHGSTRCAVPIPVLARLEIRIEDASDGQSLYLSDRETHAYVRRTACGADGRATIEHLLPGRYRVSAGGAFEAADVEVPRDTSVILRRKE
ncbi:MAG: hypothetical protein R3F20_06875 [Planctomycetota bacterium]